MEEAREGKRIGGEIVSKLDDIVINCQKSCNECLKCEYNGDEYFKWKMVKLFNAWENLDSKKWKDVIFKRECRLFNWREWACK